MKYTLIVIVAAAAINFFLPRLSETDGPPSNERRRKGDIL